MRSAPLPYRGFPEDSAAKYRAAGIWRDETLPGFWRSRAAKFANNLALVARDSAGVWQRLSYRELNHAAESVAARLHRAGVRPGDRVVLALPNTAEFLSGVLGAFLSGAIPVFALPSHRETELAHFCEVADAAAILTAQLPHDIDRTVLHQSVCERLSVAPPALIDLAQATESASFKAEPFGTLALLQLSGGTTGVSKLIPRSHADYLYSVRASTEICGLGENSVLMMPLPAGHNFALSSPGVLGALHAGATVVLAPDPSPATAFDLIARERVTIAALVPPLAGAWVASAKRRHPDLSSLEVLQIGGARLSETVAAEITPVLGAKLQQVFGMAEGLVNYTRLDDADDLVLRTQGRPISEFDELLVLDADGAQCETGVEGELLTRGPYTIRGYYGAPAADANSFTPDGFYRTGDLVRLTPEGYIQVTGRIKDQINRAGEKIACDELEDLVLAHPDVRDVVALGVPDQYLGERVALVLLLEPNAPTPALREYLRGCGLADFKLPDDVVALPEFPVTGVGKNSRRDLRELLFNDLTLETLEGLVA